MSRTYRWWNKTKYLSLFPDLCLSRNVNPYWGRHEDKHVRVTQHRNFRHECRIRLSKGLDILYNDIQRTCGWTTN